MEKPTFLAGTEEKFNEFISNIGKEKVGILSHKSDLDGIASAKIVSSVIKADIIKFLEYDEINEELVNFVEKEEIKKLIITDLSIGDPKIIKEIEKTSDILIIDHHVFSEDMNSSKTTFINAKSFCAAYLSYYLFSNIKNMEKLDWLASLASISDWAYFQNTEFMEETFRKYGDQFVIEEGRIRKSGKFWDLQWDLTLAIIYFRKNVEKVFEAIDEKFGEIKNINENIKEVQEEIDKIVKDFEDRKEEIKEGYFFEIAPKFPIGSIISTLTSSNHSDKTVIIVRKDNGFCKVSARRQDKKTSMNELLKKLTEKFEDSSAGGHVAAAGGHFPEKYYEEFKKRLIST